MKKYELIFKCSNFTNKFPAEDKESIKEVREIKKIVDEIYSKILEFEDDDLFFLESFCIDQETCASEFGFSYDFYIKLEELTTDIKYNIENYIETKAKEIISKDNNTNISFRIIDKPFSQEIDICVLEFTKDYFNK